MLVSGYRRETSAPRRGSASSDLRSPAPSPVSLEVVNDRDELQKKAGDIEVLARSAIEANVFQEPWTLFPALEAFAQDCSLSFVLAYANGRHPGDERPELCGFFPLERKAICPGLPIARLSLWRHPYSFLSTPLLKNGYAADVLSALFSYFKNDTRGVALLELPHVSASGPFHSALERALARDPALRCVDIRFERALFRPARNASDYMKRTIGNKTRKEYRRLARRLSEQGRVTWDELDDREALRPWVDEFLRLEASGWKGRADTAFASNDQDRRFFHAITEAALAKGRLHVLALRLDGRAIAMKCNLMAADGGFAFKIAYDEAFRRYSPGVLLELEHIRRLHDRTGMRWMDSCADPDHFMANRLWSDRKPLRTLQVATSGGVGAFALATIELARRIAGR